MRSIADHAERILPVACMHDTCLWCLTVIQLLATTAETISEPESKPDHRLGTGSNGSPEVANALRPYRLDLIRLRIY